MKKFFLLLVLLMLTGCSSQTAVSETKKPQEKPTVETNRIANIEQLKDYVKTLCPPNYTEQEIAAKIYEDTEIDGGYAIVMEMTTDKLSREDTYNYSKDFIIKAYETVKKNTLPVFYITAIRYDKDGGRMFFVGFAPDIYEKMGEQKNKMSGKEFIDWVKKNKAETSGQNENAIILRDFR